MIQNKCNLSFCFKPFNTNISQPSVLIVVNESLIYIERILLEAASMDLFIHQGTTRACSGTEPQNLVRGIVENVIKKGYFISTQFCDQRLIQKYAQRTSLVVIQKWCYLNH